MLLIDTGVWHGWQIENFALHIIRTTELWDRLSPLEQEFAQK
jgi:hypothetical protein